jgi:tagatose-1,6-bisphosphate aldolase
MTVDKKIDRMLTQREETNLAMLKRASSRASAEGLIGKLVLELITSKVDITQNKIIEKLQAISDGGCIRSDCTADTAKATLNIIQESEA